ncbi:MAG: GNAT family N-acetyltransferase [Opitutales bacterium]
MTLTKQAANEAMGVFATTAARIGEFEKIYYDYTLQRLNCIREDEAPLVEYRGFGNIRAFRLKSLPDWDYPNTAFGYDARSLPFALDWYRDAGIPARFEIPVSHLDEADRAQLNDSGLRYQRTHCAFGRSLSDLKTESAFHGIGVEDVTEDNLETFIETLLDGYSVDLGREIAYRNMRRWLEFPEQHLFLARLKQRPAGVGVLYVDGATAYLAAAATIPAFRGRGVHSALIAHRALVAKELGANVLYGGAYFGTTSMRNQQAAGLALVYPRLVWGDGDSGERASPQTSG